jgi:hypothetical protein
MSLWSFQGAGAGPLAGLSKLNSMRDIEVDVVLGEPGSPTAEAIKA